MRLCKLLGVRAAGSKDVDRPMPRRKQADATTARTDAVAMNSGVMNNGAENPDCGTRFQKLVQQ